MPVSLPFFDFIADHIVSFSWHHFMIDRPMDSNVRIIKPGDRGHDSIKWVEQISHYLDSRFTIPGTKIRFGLDPLFSLFPVVGDFITFMISCALIYIMHQHGASRKVVIKMMLNSTFDAVLGSIPVVGTVFDVFYRSNDRNIRLLKEHYYEGKHQGSGNGILLVVAIACIVLVAAGCYGIYKILEMIF